MFFEEVLSKIRDVGRNGKIEAQSISLNYNEKILLSISFCYYKTTNMKFQILVLELTPLILRIQRFYFGPL